MLELEEKKRVVKLGICISFLFLIALNILIFAVYTLLSQNFQNVLIDYTIKFVQSMVEQGVTTIEYELLVSQEETVYLADSFSVLNKDEEKVIFPTTSSKSNILRMVYISKNRAIASDGQQLTINKRQDIMEAFSGEISIYGPYFNEDNKYIICYSAPVYKDGKVIGVLSIEKDGYYFCSLIKNIPFADIGEAYIINSKGNDIAVSNQNYIAWVNNQYNIGSILEKHNNGINDSVMKLEQKGFNGQTGVDIYYSDRGPCYMTYAPISSVQWILLAELQKEEIISMTESALYIFIVKSPIFIICVVIFFCLPL